MNVETIYCLFDLYFYWTWTSSSCSILLILSKFFSYLPMFGGICMLSKDK